MGTPVHEWELLGTLVHEWELLVTTLVHKWQLLVTTLVHEWEWDLLFSLCQNSGHLWKLRVAYLNL